MADAYSVDLTTGILSYDDANPPFSMTSKLFNNDLNLLCNGYGHYYIDDGMAKVDDDPFSQADRELTVRGSITSLAGDHTDLDSTDIIGVQTYIDIGKVFPIGATPSASMQLILSNVNRQWDGFNLDGSEVEIELGAKNESDAYEYFSLGIFVIERVDSQEGNPVIIIQASDYMSNKMMKEWADPRIYPRTYGEIVQDACNQAGVTISSAAFTYNDETISTQPTFPDRIITCRDIVGWIAELSCSNAFINRDGELQIRLMTYTDDDNSLRTSLYYKTNTDSFPISNQFLLNAYPYGAPSGTLPLAVVGVSGVYDPRAYTSEVSGNPFLMYSDGTTFNYEIALRMSDACFWMLFRASGRVSWHGNAENEICDTLTVKKLNGSDFKIGTLQQRIGFSAETGLVFETGCDLAGTTLAVRNMGGK